MKTNIIGSQNRILFMRRMSAIKGKLNNVSLIQKCKTIWIIEKEMTNKAASEKFRIPISTISTWMKNKTKLLQSLEQTASDTVKPLNNGHFLVLESVSIIKRCPLLGGSLTKILTFGTKHFVRYSRHVRYLGCPLLGAFTVQRNFEDVITNKWIRQFQNGFLYKGVKIYQSMVL